MNDWISIVSVVSGVGALLAIIALFFRIGVWKGGVDSDRETFKGFMNEIRNDIKQILKRLPPDTVRGDSPLQLTDLGKKVAKEIQASDWVKKVALTITSEDAGKHPYEVQEFCLEYVKREKVLSEDMQEKVKTSAFENGIQKEQVLRVLAVELRDQLLMSST